MIDEINHDMEKCGARISGKRSLGYHLVVENRDRYELFLESYSEISQENNTLLKEALCVLFFQGRYTKVDDLCDILHISRSSIRGLMKEVKVLLSHYGLNLLSRPGYGLEVKGNEGDIRKCAYENLSDVCFGNKSDYEENLPFLNKTLVDTFNEIDIPIMILTHEQLIDHLVVYKNRWLIGRFVSLKDDYSSIDRGSKEYLASKKIVFRLSQHYGVEVPEDEIIFLTLYLIGNKVSKIDELDRNVVSDINRNILEIFRFLDEKYETRFSENDDLRVSIIMHVTPLINRIKYNIVRQNPLNIHIKSHYPLSYEIAVSFALEFKERWGFSLNEDEISYIALHFSLAMQQKREETKKLKVLVICPFGHTMASLTAIRLKKLFPDKIGCIEKNSMQNLDLQKYDGFDLIISLGRSEIERHDIRKVVVSPSLNEKDLKILEEVFSELEGKKHFTDFINEDIFFVDVKGSNNVEVLTNMVDMIPDKYKAPGWLLDSLLERESIAPTDVGNQIAIPHAVRNDFPKTFIAIGILEKNILWWHEEVRLVFLFCLNPRNNGDLTSLYENLTRLVEDEKRVSEIILNKSYAETYRLIKELNR